MTVTIQKGADGYSVVLILPDGQVLATLAGPLPSEREAKRVAKEMSKRYARVRRKS
jgi:hypothetical protein